MKYEVKDPNAPSRWNMRIWDDDKKEWLCQSDKDALTYYGFDITGGETTEFQGLPKWHPDRHLIWEQSTSLKDKNGKEIYEGDIIAQTSINDPFSKRYPDYIVYWCEEYLSWGVKDAWGDDGNDSDLHFFIAERQKCEVIGNIHENPELIRGKE